MSSIMRARSALTGRSEEWEVIEASSLKPKVAGPSMLGIGCPDRHVLPLTPAENAWTVTHASSRESGFVLGWLPALGTRGFHGPLSDPRADLRLRFHGSERDGRNVPRADLDSCNYSVLPIAFDRTARSLVSAIYERDHGFVCVLGSPALSSVLPE